MTVLLKGAQVSPASLSDNLIGIFTRLWNICLTIRIGGKPKFSEGGGPCTASLYITQIPHGMFWYRILGSAMTDRWIRASAWSMVRPNFRKKIWSYFPTECCTISNTPRFLSGSQISPVCLPVRLTCRWIWVWSIGGIIPIWIKACSNTTFSTTNVTCTELILNPRLRGNRTATNYLSHFTGEIL